MVDESHVGLPSFAVVVPMFNERSGAERCVREITRVLSGLPHRASLIVVDDGSKDGTTTILQALSQTNGVLELLSNPVNRGYGAALAAGARRAFERGFEYALFMDSDLTNSPDDIPRFAERMSERVDVIKATRYSGGGSVRGVPFYRVAISAAGNLVARILFRLPLHDCTNGFRAVRASLLCQMRLTERGFSIIMEELYWCRFLASRYAEVPVTLTNRQGEQRPTSFRYRPSVFWRYLKYPLRAFVGVRPRSFPGGS
jgi:glycosyltransferase involved in cell wall biosynthesis